jgi:hypothetical protein
MTAHGLAPAAYRDATAFLARLSRLDPAAVVRLRSLPGSDRTVLWGRLPWEALVSRTVPGAGPGDATVVAADLLAELERGGTELPERRDPRWRWPLPPASQVVETVPAAEVRRVAEAAAATLRSASTGGVGGRPVGARALRDALLDHVAIVVNAAPDPSEPPAAAAESGVRVEVRQRLVQALTRMGFVPPAGADADENVQVRRAGRWIGLSTRYGTVWLQPAMPVAPPRHRPHPFV